MIPETLRNLPQWVLWRYEQRGGEPTKVPYSVTGERASSTNPTTWTEYGKLATSTLDCEGLGFVFKENGGIVGIDLDGCRNKETGEIQQWAKDIAIKFDSYTEVSPSETGLKIFILGTNPLKTGRNKKLDLPESYGKKPGIEVYDRGRYFAVTGKSISKLPSEPQERQSVLDDFMNEHWPAKSVDVVDRARAYLNTMPAAVSGSGGHNATFRAACVLVLGFGLSRSEGLALLCEYNQRCSPPWSIKDLEHKIDSALKQDGPRNYLRDVQQENFASVRIPVYKQQEQPAKPQKQIRKTTLLQAANGYIEKLRNGDDSLVQLGLPQVDDMLGGGVAIGEMIVLAGRPSHGKTAVALQIVHHLTQQGTPALFISEEMSSLQLGKRSLQFLCSTNQHYWSKNIDGLQSDLNDYGAERADCHIIEGCGDVDTVAEQVKIHVEQHNVQVVVIDYVQRLQAPGKSRYEQVTNASIALSNLRTKHPIVLIVLAQLGREIEKRKPFVPMPSDLKESGQIEQDADVVLFQVWPWKIDKTAEKNSYEFFCGKNRNREICNEGHAKCQFLPDRQMFTSLIMQNFDESLVISADSGSDEFDF